MEYRALLAPLARAEDEIEYALRMLHARFEDEICNLSPALGALAEMLRVSALDMLLAEDRVSFVESALGRSGLTADEIRLRLVEASSTAREDLKLLGFGERL
jgi:hypothetical protein